MILDSLRIENFRMLADFQIPRLGQVNLIVGKNNSGKSTVIEAIQILASQGNPSVLSNIVSGHDENLVSDFDSSDEDSDGVEYAFRHLFPGRGYPLQDEQPILIGDIDQKRSIKIEHKLYIDEFEEVTDSTGELIRRRRRVPVSKADMFVKDIQLSQALLISNSSRSFWFDLATDAVGRRYRSSGIPDVKELPYSTVPTGFLEPDFLADLWDRAALTELERFVIRALQTIDPAVSGLAFVKRDNDRASFREKRSSRTAIVRLGKSERPVPLNSMGDGMHRVLQLILAMFPARGGVFLIDEFENGLHYSVQQKVWSLVFELSRILNVQVFATTHSRDCIDAFSDVSQSNKETEGVVFRVSQGVSGDEAGKVIATVFDEDKLGRLTSADVEIR